MGRRIQAAAVERGARYSEDLRSRDDMLLVEDTTLQQFDLDCTESGLGGDSDRVKVDYSMELSFDRERSVGHLAGADCGAPPWMGGSGEHSS